jgi:SAM-dependent methyltransferase
MSAEFDTVAEWTAQVARDLGPPFYIPAGCRGSGNPAALDWLIEELDLNAADVLLDCGAGVGGPAAYAAHRQSVSPVLIEPEASACRAARSLFGYPVSQATAGELPFPDQSFDAAWSLGVLCTTPDQLALLTELRRVVRRPGRIGLLVFLADSPMSAQDQPDGNHFPTEESLQHLLAESGLVIEKRLCTADLPPIPQDWQTSVEMVEAELRRRHRDDPAWALSEQQSAQMGRLLGEHTVTGHVLSLRFADE